MKKALIIGTGVLGITLGRRLSSEGYELVYCNRSGEIKLSSSLTDGARYTCIGLDLLNNNELDSDIISGIDAVYFCAAPKYWAWQEELVPLVKNAMSVATKLGVSFIYADNLYAYGKTAAHITEQTARNPQTRKGLARNQALELVLQAHKKGELKTAVVQSADFYGPGVDISMVGKSLFDSVKNGQPVNCLGNVDNLHSFIYIGDFADAMLRVKNDPNSFGQVWIAPCAEPISMRTFIGIVARNVNRDVKLRVAPTLLFWFLGLTNKAIRELREVDYLYYDDFFVDSKKFEKHFQQRPTSIEDGIRSTL